MLTALPDIETWHYEEINPIRCQGGLSHRDDAIPPDAAKPRTRRFIRGVFPRVWRETGTPDAVVEKTRAYSHRMPFVDAILPEAGQHPVIERILALLPGPQV